jgi:hypothetical protein
MFDAEKSPADMTKFGGHSVSMPVPAELRYKGGRFGSNGE